MGRFLKEWRVTIDNHLKTIQRKLKKTETGSIWVTTITEILFHFAWEVWIEHNTDRHGRDKMDRKRLLIERALVQTKELYWIRLDVLPMHRELYYDLFEHHTQSEKSSKGLQQWISTLGNVLIQSEERAHLFGITRMRSI